MLAAIRAVVLLLAALVVGAVWLTVPETQQTASISGLSGVVDIRYDTDWVPRIRAGSETDAASALGFLHARDRLFQMDLMRRAASGRLSEIAGPATLPMDRMMRTLGLRQRAMADFATLPPDTQTMLEAYARGVNALIDLKGRFAAPEFLVLGSPERWEATDCLLWAKTMGLWLSMNWRQELARQAVAGRVPAAMLEQMWPPQTAVPAPDAMNASSTRFAETASRLLAVLPQFPGAYTLPWSASNEWAVDGRHSVTGRPLLAGDPHLAFSFPGIWYLARIDMPGRVLAGATAPGVPFLVLGHNGKIAWTFTTTGADVQDIFIETPAGPGEYQTPSGPKPFALREERIKVRGQDDVVLTVRATRHGPVISDLDHPDGPIMAVAMGNLQPADTAASGLLALNRAGSGTGRGNRGHGDQFAGAESSGGGREHDRDVRHRPGADPQGRRWVRAGLRRWIARLDRMGLRRAVTAQRLAGKRSYRECQRAGVAARFSHIHGPRHVRCLAGEPDPGVARPVRPADACGLRCDAGRRRRHVRQTSVASFDGGSRDHRHG